MAFLPERVLNPTKRSVWRGIAAGLLSHYAALALLLVIFVPLKPFIWSILFGSPDWASKGPVDPNSAEGTILQILGAVSWLPAGAAAMHWGGRGGARAVFALFIYLAVLFLAALAGNTVPAMPFGRAIWYWLSAPIGIAVGLFTYHGRLQRKRAPSSALEAPAQSDA